VPATDFATAPIHVLLGTPLHAMTPDQVKVFNQRVRQLKAAPQTVVKSIKDENSIANKKPAVSKAVVPQVDVKKTAAAYL
jgi:hypothetical protein